MKKFNNKFKNQVWLIAIISLLLLQSCEKPGCTNSKASNYDSDATEDDGSCIIKGCTDLDAVNYDYDANYDDGSCYYPDGEGVFWTDDDYGHGYISVYLENNLVGQITNYCIGFIPSCGKVGCVTISRPPGNYSFHATADDWYWDGIITINSNDCSKMRLYNKKEGIFNNNMESQPILPSSVMRMPNSVSFQYNNKIP